MIYLLLAVFFGSSIAVFLKYLRRCGVGIGETICVNYIVATLVGIVVNAARYDLHINPLGEFWCWMAFVRGSFMVGALMMIAVATESYGVVMSTVASKVSFVVPVIGSWLLLGDREPLWLAVLGMLIALLLLCMDGKPMRWKGKIRMGIWHLPIVFLCYGLSNFLLRVAQNDITSRYGDDTVLIDAQFNAFASASFLFALICGTLLLVVRDLWKGTADSIKKTGVGWHSLWSGLSLGVVNMACTYCMMRALEETPTTLFYPIYNVGVVSITAFCGWLFFRERLTKYQVGGLLLSLLTLMSFT